MGISFSVIPQRAVEAALNEKWAGKNYSERIWGRSDDFVTAVEETVTRGLITGKSMDKRAQMLADRLGAEVDYNVKRLVRTETAHFTNQGQLKAYEAAGFEEYRYLAALSSATCEVCADLDGKIFKVYDAREGENYPPIHPNCRCTTVIADFTSGTRNARDPLTGKNYKVDGDMTFEEWKDSLTDEQRAAMENYVDKSAGSGIINEDKDSNKPITNITNTAINNVKRVNIDGLTSEQCDFIQEQHKDLLKYARDENDSKEVAYVFNSAMKKVGEYKGTADSLEFGYIGGSDLLVMHNHPRNSSYSDRDIRFLISSDEVKTLTIVKNNGNIETLTKISGYDKQEAKTMLSRIFKKNVKNETDAEISKAINMFLKKYTEGLKWEQ